MLYPDSKRRISDILEASKLFKEKGYVKTATRIHSYIEILRGTETPENFLKELESLFAIFHREFERKLTVGQHYRKRIFQEVVRIVMQAVKRMGSAFPQALLEVYPIFQRLSIGRGIVGAIAEEIMCGGISDKNVIFHLRCYTYLIIVEGIYDELSRLLHFLTVISPTNVLALKDLENLTVWEIMRQFGTRPVFLEDWEDKNHVRNAIGHARADYDPAKDTVQFTDINMRDGTKWNSGVIPATKFYEKALELEDSIAAFYYTFMLLRMYDLILSKNPYQE